MSNKEVKFKFLSDRFTKKERELAAKISNDIAEDIDCKESKKQLRIAVDFWASYASDVNMLFQYAKGELEGTLTANLKILHDLINSQKKLNED